MQSSVVKYGPIKGVVLFGGTTLMSRVAAALRHKFAVVMFTAPRQAADVNGVMGVQLHVTEDIDATHGHITFADSLGIGLGEAWQFGPRLRKSFGNRLLDFMSIPYPRYLGGAHVSHAILRGETSWGCAMQLVTENTKQGEVHDGEVIDAKSMTFPSSNHHQAMEDQYLAYILDFVQRAAMGHEFQALGQRFQWSFYPRLNTAEQAWIDWSWRRGEIIRFIAAFDKPYPGARTRVTRPIADDYITLHDATEGLTDGMWHPFHFGLIVSAEGSRIQIQCLGGTIHATARNEEGKPVALPPGTRLVAVQADLEYARCYVPDYTPLGDAHAV